MCYGRGAAKLGLAALVIARFTEEGPVTTTMRRKVLLFAPACVLVRVSSSCPSPQTREDFVINANERALTDHVPMIVDPTPDFGVELMDQIWLPCLCRAFPILVLGTGSGSKGLAVERLTK